jgi:histidine phosphotransferase ChpT
MDDVMPLERQKLADLIGSRLCHDLSNPLGAIGNGVELLEMTGSAKGPEMDLIRDAVRDAQARVRFFRLAFGHAGPDHMTSAREARTALEGLYRQTRTVVHWLPEDDLPRRQVKLAYLMLMCVETALPMGGEVSLSMERGGLWCVAAKAGRIVVDDALWSVLRFGPDAAGRPLRPAEVQFMALHEAAEQMGLTLNYVAEDGSLRVSTA